MSDPLNLFCGDPETGEWCGRCNLPSAIRVPFNSANAEGVGAGSSFLFCPDCAEEKRC